MIPTQNRSRSPFISQAANPLQTDSHQDPMLVLDLNKWYVWPVDG